MKTDGQMQFLREQPGLNYFDVKAMNQNTLLFQGEPGQTTHFLNVNTNTTIDFPNVFGHHDVEYNPNNNCFLNLRDYQRVINGR